MNKAVANILKTALAGMPMIGKLAGLVQVQEYEDTTYNDEGTVPTTVIKRIPVSCDVTTDPACEQKDLVPDGGKRGILYFEDGGASAQGKAGANYKYASRLRLVCWFNTTGLTNNPCLDVSTIMITEIQNRLSKLTMTNSGNFQRLQVDLESIPKQDKGIFAPYTYDLHNTQYLSSPYEFFALDLLISYQVHPSCIELLNFVEPLDNCV